MPDILLTFLFLLIIAGLIGAAVLYCLMEDRNKLPMKPTKNNLPSDTVAGAMLYHSLDD